MLCKYRGEGVTDEQYAAIDGYLRQLADVMGLKDWEIHLQRKRPDNPNHAACIQSIYGRRHANVWVDDAFLDDAPESQRETLTHELLHLHINPIKHALQNARSNLGEHTYGVVEGMMDDATEFAVDGIARVLAAYLPLPPQEKTNV